MACVAIFLIEYVGDRVVHAMMMLLLLLLMSIRLKITAPILLLC